MSKYKPGIIINNAFLDSSWPAKAEVLAGNNSTTASILSEPRLSHLQNNFILLNHGSAQKLKLPQNYPLRYEIVHYAPLTIRLGPIIGVLSTVPLDQRYGLPFGKEAQLFEEMFIMARQRGILMFLFYAREIDWNRGSVKGYIWNKFQWIKQLLPLPDIVYNRIRYRKIEDSSKVQMTLKKLTNHANIYLFNSRFLNKWEVHKALNSNDRIAQFLPVTKVFNLKNFNILTNNYSEVFLKPRNSSVGKGIIKLIKKPDGNFLYQLVDDDHKLITKTAAGKRLYNELKKYIKEPQRYLVQQGINLARLNDNIFDLRTQVQKDGQGIWRLTGLGARVASNKGFLTHLPNGGQTASYQEIVANVFDNSDTIKDKINNQIDTILRYVPQCLERELKLSLAVLSIDIGIDNTGKMWIIEVNSKPANFEEDAIRQKYIEYFNDYCLFIFSKKQK